VYVLNEIVDHLDHKIIDEKINQENLDDYIRNLFDQHTETIKMREEIYEDKNKNEFTRRLIFSES
jgi:hypothetical protein